MIIASTPYMDPTLHPDTMVYVGNYTCNKTIRGEQLQGVRDEGKLKIVEIRQIQITSSKTKAVKNQHTHTTERKRAKRTTSDLS
jgi:hypothetical protein